MSYVVNEQVALDPKVHDAPLRQCVGGPADGLSRRVPDGYALICALVTQREMNAVALPLDQPVIETCMSMGTYRGHYVVQGDTLAFVDSRRETTESK